MRVRFMIPELGLELLAVLNTIPAKGTRISFGDELEGFVESVELALQPIQASKWLDAVDCIVIIKVDKRANIPVDTQSRWPGYNPATDVYTILGHRFSGALFSALCESNIPGPWFRIIKRADGMITMETKGDGGANERG